MDNIQSNLYSKFIENMNQTLVCHVKLLKTTKMLYEDLQAEAMLSSDYELSEKFKKILFKITMSAEELLSAADIQDSIDE